MIYLVSDIHGEYDKFKQLLRLVNFNKNDFMYILGDVVDRGPEPIKLLRFIMEQENMEMLLGNHEDMMLTWYNTKRYEDKEQWFSNGGKATHNQFIRLSGDIRQEIIDYLNKRPLYVVLDKYILVHAGICGSYSSYSNIQEYMRQQSRVNLLWMREDFYNQPVRVPGYKVIFGHTPTYYCYSSRGYICESMSIWHDNLYEDKIGIDCGAFHRDGQLGCIRFDDMQEFYVGNEVQAS